MANMIQMMQKAAQMKQKMQEMQARVERMDVTGEAGSGMVKCVVSGRFEVKSIKIEPSAVNPQEVDVLEDMLVVALNDARKKAEKLMGEETQKIMKDLGLPAGMDLPF